MNNFVSRRTRSEVVELGSVTYQVRGLTTEAHGRVDDRSVGGRLVRPPHTVTRHLLTLLITNNVCN